MNLTLQFSSYASPKDVPSRITALNPSFFILSIHSEQSTVSRRAASSVYVPSPISPEESSSVSRLSPLAITLMSRPSCLYTACRSCAYASLVLAAPFTFFFGVGIAGGGAASGSVDESFSATVLGAVLVRSSDLPGSWRSLEFSSESELENDPFTNNSSTAPRTTIAHGPIPDDVT